MTSPGTTTRLVAVTSTGQVSGAERVLLRTLTAAVERGWDVTCLCPTGPLAEQLRATGARHVAIPEQNLAAGPKLLAALVTVLRWWQASRRLRAAQRSADVVLANALLSLPAVRLARWPRVPFARARRVPALWLAHDVVVSRGRLRLYGWCSSALSGVVGVSEAVISRLRGTSVASAGPMLQVVHNGVTFPVAPAQERTGATHESPLVGLNGLLTPWKGQQVLLDAVPLLDEAVRVELLGGTLPKDADYAAALASRVDELGIGDRVEILGHHPDPLARMRTWTIAVSASTDPEACPLAVLEAMSIGLPVVATDHGGAPEVLDGAGLLVPPRDAVALADAINDMVRHTELRTASARHGLDRVSAAHRLDVQTDQLLDVLNLSAREGHLA